MNNKSIRMFVLFMTCIWMSCVSAQRMLFYPLSHCKYADTILCIDINRDGLRDSVIQIGDASDNQWLRIYIQTSERKFQKEMEEAVRIVCLPSDTQKFLVVKNEACCGGNMEFYKYFVWNSEMRHFQQVYKWSITIETQVPDDSLWWKEPLPFKSSEIGVCLRATPCVDDSSEFWDLRQKGNLLVKWTHVVSGNVYASYENPETKQTWCFVFVENINHEKWPFSERDDDFICGWINSRCLSLPEFSK